MKVTSPTLLNIVLVTILAASFFLVNTTASIYEYDPWCDINDDGKIRVDDVLAVALRFGTDGDPINKTALLLELLDKIDSLNATVIELQNTVNYLNNTVVYLNETIVYLNSTGFGAPDYDSGWINFPTLTWIQINHNLGTRNIIVYMVGNFGAGTNTHQRAYGGDICDTGEWKQYGAWWQSKDENSMYVYNTARGQPDIFWKQVRVLIWKIPEP